MIYIHMIYISIFKLNFKTLPYKTKSDSQIILDHKVQRMDSRSTKLGQIQGRRREE